MATVTDISTVPYSGNYQADALLHETAANWNYLLPSRSTLYYTFDCSTGSVIDKATAETLTAFNAAQKSAAASILSYASTVTGITFAEVSSGSSADFHFGNINISGASTSGLCRTENSYGYTTGQVLTSYNAEAYIYLDNVEWASINTTPTAGSSGYEVLLHEIGHALGLGHPFDGSYTLPAAEDNTSNTVMSYTGKGGYKSTFQAYDLLALTWIYGKDGLGGSYGYNSTKGPSLSASGTSTTTTTTTTSTDPAPTSGGSKFTGTTGADIFVGTSGNDVFLPGKGNDTINGGTGYDLAVFSNAYSTYSVTSSNGVVTVKDNAGTDGTDTLTSVERLKFSDKTIALDISGNAGQVYRVYQAAFDRKPDLGGLGDWIYGMDTGMSLTTVAAGFIASTEFATLYGSAPSTTDLVNRLYLNVLHRTAEKAGFDYWMNQLNAGLQSRSQVLTGFSESPENQAQVIGQIQNGIEYTIHG